MNNCYIMAFNKKIRLISLNNNVLKADVDELTNLKYIDSIISKYNEKDFKEYLFRNSIIESMDTPICIVNEYINSNNLKDINVYKIITKGTYNNYLNNNAYLLEKFQQLYFSDDNYREIANKIMGEDEVKRIFYFNGYSGRNYKLNYMQTRNIVLSLNIFDVYKDYKLYELNDYDFESHKDEIISLLSTKTNI